MTLSVQSSTKPVYVEATLSLRVGHISNLSLSLDVHNKYTYTKADSFTPGRIFELPL